LARGGGERKGERINFKVSATYTADVNWAPSRTSGGKRELIHKPGGVGKNKTHDLPIGRGFNTASWRKTLKRIQAPLEGGGGGRGCYFQFSLEAQEKIRKRGGGGRQKSYSQN